MAAGTTASPLLHQRVNGIDLLRGLVMIIMALDHARDLLHFGAMIEDPLALPTTTVPLFFTRWITHFCAPVFVFLSGTSIYLQSLRKSKKELSGFLLKRGLWLIVAEVVIVTFGISFDPGWSFIFLQVIWAIGVGMVILAALIWLPFPVLLALCFVLVFGHNALDYYEDGRTDFSFGYQLLHKQAFLPYGDGRLLAILYPFLPWVGVMLAGYCFGRLYQRVDDVIRRRKMVLMIGVAVVLLFVCLRWLNAYGDPRPWSEQSTPFRTFLSFLNTEKYPPSLIFLCMTLGPALIFLSLFENVRNRISRIIIVYGRVPFFYYILHFYFLHIISAILFLLKGHTAAEGLKGAPGLPFKFIVPGEGLRLWQVYLVWLAVVALLYPLCRWYGRYKQTHKHWWLSYV